MALTMRDLFETYRTAGVDICTYLFVDGSPSSGYEALNCAEHFETVDRWWNRDLLVGFLGYGQQGLLAKSWALLWKLFLETGPSETLMRWRLRAVRGLTTDCGTEAGIAFLPDLLPFFWKALVARSRYGPSRDCFLW